MGFIVALEYDLNAVDLSREFKKNDSKVARRQCALFDEPISQKSPLFAEQYKN